MLYSDNSQQLIIMNIAKDCKITHNDDFAIITANSVDGIAATGEARTGIRISIHKDALIKLVGELCRPYIKKDLAFQAERGKQYRVIKISTDPGTQGANVPEQLIRDVLSGLA